ncbi:MAG: peptide-methionine (S)-S-oxide reductase MsrA, partial [Candidatus Nanohaloarchaea archaeon]
AEVVKVEFEPEEVSLKEVLQLFFRIHDPTTKDREGPDVGSQYRSMVLYSDREQQRAVESFLDSARGRYEDGIVTEVRPLEEFHRAEEKHQDYFEKNPNDSYCRMHAAPKARKAREF